MRSITTDTSGFIRWPRVKSHRMYSRPTLRKRFCRYIETSAWDEKLLNHEKRMNRICLGYIILSVLYFLPIFILSVLK